MKRSPACGTDPFARFPAPRRRAPIFVTAAGLFLLLSAPVAGAAPAAAGEAPADSGSVRGRAMTLEEAVEAALSHTSRAAMIRGDQEVAERTYQAHRLNFYVPVISINGSAPAYSEDQSYKFFGASARKQLYKTSNFGFNSFIQLRQSLITGGTFVANANLTARNDRYPDTSPSPIGPFLSERSRQGYFDFNLEQPLLKPSQPRNELQDNRDDLALADLTRYESEGQLTKDVTEAYVALLQSSLDDDLSATRLKAARLQAEVDSAKWQDGVITEEDWLLSASARLDAVLNRRESEASLLEKDQAFALLLDLDPASRITPTEPAVPAPPDKARRAELLGRWQGCLAVRKAEREYAKAVRSSDFARGGRGLTGDLKASYSVGRGRVTLTNSPADDIRTNGWDLSLDFSYPIFDGGASEAEVQAARVGAERARLQLETARQNAHAEIIRLFDALDVSYRRLDILRKQVGLARGRLDIAQERFDDGRITEVSLLDARAAWVEARGKYLDELKTYLLNRIDLQTRFREDT